jgi:hypothetical protein
MNEYQQLLQRYGVSSQQLPYAGMAKPADTAAPDYADLMSKYSTDRSAYDKWLDSYKQRVASRSMYDPAFTGEMLDTPTYEYGAGYTTPKAPTAPTTPAVPVAPVSGLQRLADGGQDFGGFRADMGNWDTSGRSLTGGLIPGLFQGQAPAPVSDLSTYSDAARAAIDAQTAADNAREASMSAAMAPTYSDDTSQRLDGTYFGSPAFSSPVSSGSAVADNSYGGFGDTTGGSDTMGIAGEYARGGMVRRKYAEGSLVDLAGRYGMAGADGPPDVRQSEEMSPAQPNLDSAPVASDEDVMAMYNKYQPTTQPYAQELTAARKAASEQTEAFNQMLQKAIAAPGEAAPSKAEMYFQLAAAFGAPTRTGSFGESLGKAGEVLGEQQKAQRAAEKAQRAQTLTLGLEGQKMKMQTAKEDLGALRTLAGEEMKDVRARYLEDLKDRRARDLEALREKYKAGAPASEAGKLAADAGLVRGTPEFNKFVSKYIDDKMSSGNEYKAIMAGIAQQGLELRQQAGERAAEQAKKLTPQELKLKTDTEDMVAQTDQALSNLKRAYALNPTTFDASTVDVVQRKALEAVGSKDPKVVNTREMENLLEKAALSQLKATFPGAISNDERKALQDVQGLSSKSKEERGLIMKNGYKALQSVRERSAKRLNEINQGLYRDTAPATGEIE